MPNLRQHIEAQFQQGMTWNNRRKSTDWNMDHVIPVKPKGGDLEHLLEHLNYRNIRPL